MSVKAMEWAAEAPLRGPDKWVLLALAWYADDQRGTAYPGQETLAQWAGIAVRTVREALVRLEADGWIERERRRSEGGWRTSDLYRLRPGRQPERARKKDAAAERREALPAPGAASPTGERRRMSPTGASRRSYRRLSPGKEELRSSLEPLVEREALAEAIPAAPEPKRRDTRIPDDWAPTEALRAFARERVAWSTPEALAEEFVTHWQAAGGKSALKRNWDAAFRTWCLNAAKFGPPRGWTPPAAPAPEPATPEDEYRARLKAWCSRIGMPLAEYEDNRADPEWVAIREREIGAPVPVR